MSTNYNRIKVSDLETDDPDKILVTNSKGELEFIATKNIKVDNYNALDYDQEGKALDARQGKILKDLVNNKTDKGGFQGTAQDLANSIPDLNSSNLKLGSYPSTRSDGQLSINKVLSTDASGNLKLYSLPISPTYPAPYLTEILPYIFLPNTTGNIILKGSFFTPNMTVVIQGQTVNYLKFKSDNEVHANVTSGSEEGSFGITLNNGLSTTFENVLIIVLGTVFKPLTSEWTLTEPINVDNDKVFTQTWNSLGTAVWSKVFDKTKNYRIGYQCSRTPLGPAYQLYREAQFSLHKVSDNTKVFSTAFSEESSGRVHLEYYSLMDNANDFLYTGPANLFDSRDWIPEFRAVSGIMYLYLNGVLVYTFNQPVLDDYYLKVYVKCYDLSKIKYIETT
ncbi:hypothetical protein L0669_22030 [Flavobacterium bizetiae]|uniref:hypothetical protein n=1 Tax=Flavobacterium bizetiae TaxID=2704140 RepID=UPI0021E99B68|nr:hypothetical protein [Flavobacterium bizetiae]UTN03990.1 hypothetical protein L0669_22030 [Flavobacterium bizetiae]